MTNEMFFFVCFVFSSIAAALGGSLRGRFDRRGRVLRGDGDLRESFDC
jgi:hypothetical protein